MAEALFHGMSLPPLKGNTPMNNDDSTPEDGYGYDPTIDEGIAVVPPEPIAPPYPTKKTVSQNFLPPVGQQGPSPASGYPGSCASWASTYGLATFTAAKAGNYTPSSSAQWASPAYIYIKVLQEKTPPVTNTCVGSQFASYFQILAAGGTPNMEQAPYFADCPTLWSDYANMTLPPDAVFALGKIGAVPVKDSNNLDMLRQVILSDRALVYGTSLYSDWGMYKGDPVPYVGTPPIVKNKNTHKPAGHCMLIIGYDDDMQAVLLQNSQGTGWGSAGYVWMAYTTFTTLAQRNAYYVMN